MSSPKELDELLQAALSLHEKGELAEAANLYHQILKDDPNEPAALHLLGLLAFQQRQGDAAIGWMKKALSVNPRSAVCYRDLGLVYYGLERFKEAASAFRQAIELQPHFPEALCNWGNLYREFGCFAQAIHCYEQALAQQAQCADALESIRGIQKNQKEMAEFAENLTVPRSHGKEWKPGAPESVKLERRELLPHVLNQLGLKGVGAEIGVREGSFSERILRLWEGSVLYSIDPWREFPAGEYVDVANVAQSQQDERYKQTIKRLRPFQRRSVIWRLTSREAAELLPNDSLDFCYIDADHRYEGVREDIRLWHPKIKRGGLLAGHDYVPDGNYSFGAFGVQRAVNEFVRDSNLDLYISREGEYVVNDKRDLGFPSWFVVKR